MKFQQVLSSALLSASAIYSANAAPLEERANAISVTGVPNNGVQTRMELRTMQRDHADMFNLYLLGLQDFMKVDQTDPMSFYQIAGIHGRPYTPWSGVSSSGGSGGYGGGYCTHTSNLFLPWHRPYLAVYEQALYNHVQTVAAKFTGSDKTRYQNAAANFRIPYWDWAAAPPCAECQAWPLLVSQQYTTVNTPSGQQTIINPLSRYDFHPSSKSVQASDMVYSPFSTWTVTKRYPTAWNDSGVSQNNLVATLIQNQRVSFADRIYNLFQNSNFTQFGNEAWITSTTQNADSLESLHDVIHSLTGSNGHTTYLDYAAWDPIFFLHHANVDRYFAMYQVVHGGSNNYVKGQNAVGSTYTYSAGTYRDVNSPLQPFYNSAGVFYTSANVQDTTKFGYNYPETVSGATTSSVTSAIKKLYGGSAGSSTTNKRDVVDDIAAAAGVQESSTGNGNSYQWGANIVSQKFQLNGTYAVYVFCGEPSDNPLDWASDSNLAGIHAVFANFPGDDNAMVNMDLKVTGAIPLTTTLVSKVASGDCPSLKPEDVEPYLTKNLNWRVQMLDGTVIDNGYVPDLSVTVTGAEVTPAKSDGEFPTWGSINSYSNITTGKTGGHSEKYWSTSSWSSHTESSWSVGQSINYGLGGSS